MLSRSDVPEVLDPDLLAALRAAVIPEAVVHTLERARPNKILAIEPEGLSIETERSKESGAPEVVPAWMFNIAWRELQRGTTLVLQEFVLVAKRSSAVFAVLARVPGIEALTEPVAIRWRRTSGHVFIVRADLNHLFCDARLIPTDSEFLIEPAFASSVHLPEGADRLKDLEWSGRRVIEFGSIPPDPMTGVRPRTWLADVGRDGRGAEWFSSVIPEFASIARDALALDERRPLLAVNVLGSGAGGGRYEKGGLHDRINRALHETARDLHVDFVLATWEPGAYAAAQNARRDYLDHHCAGERRRLWELGDRDQARLERAAKELARHKREENLVLFMGAGVSAGAGLPMWSDLLNSLAKDASPNAPIERLQVLDPRDQAALVDRWLQEAGRSLSTCLEERFTRPDYALTHGLLASLDVREHVTTNFDTLFEAANKIPGRDLAVLPDDAIEANRPWLLKLHGSVDQGNAILTRQEYLGLPRTARALFGIVQALLLTRHMMFVGYSLSDEDFHQIVDEVRSARGEQDQRVGTALTLFQDDLQAQLWGDDIDIVHMADGPPTDDPETIASAARRLQICLDLVAFEAADHLSFLLDDSYSELLDANERALKDALERLSRSVPERSSVAPDPWTRVRSLLAGFGHV